MNQLDCIQHFVNISTHLLKFINVIDRFDNGTVMLYENVTVQKNKK